MLKHIKGLLHEKEGLTLYEYAKKVPKNEHIVEIGSHQGYSTCFLALAAAGTVHAVDIWEDENIFKIFKKNIISTKVSNVKYYRNTSIEQFKLWDKNNVIGLLFIDGNHSYEYVKDDFNNWSKYCKKGAYIIFHDYSRHWPGVVKFIDECQNIDKIKCVKALYVARLK